VRGYSTQELKLGYFFTDFSIGMEWNIGLAFKSTAYSFVLEGFFSVYIIYYGSHAKIQPSATCSHQQQVGAKFSPPHSFTQYSPPRHELQGGSGGGEPPPSPYYGRP
jgi:hypothetical protein